MVDALLGAHGMEALPFQLQLQRVDGAIVGTLRLRQREPSTLSWPAAVALRQAVTSACGPEVRTRVVYLWKACSRRDAMARLLSTVYLCTVPRARAATATAEVAAQLLLVRSQWAELCAMRSYPSITGRDRQHPCQKLWRRVTCRLNGNVRHAREAKYAARDRALVAAGHRPKPRRLQVDRSLWHSVLARKQWAHAQVWREQVLHSAPVTDETTMMPVATSLILVRAGTAAALRTRHPQLRSLSMDMMRMVIGRRRAQGSCLGFLQRPLSVEAGAVRPSWKAACLPLHRGIRHDTSERVADRLILGAVGLMQGKRTRIASPARIGEMLRQAQVQVGARGWEAAARQAVQGRRFQYTERMMAPATISASAQLQYQCARGRAEAVAVETIMQWLEIPRSPLLLSILRGRVVLGEAGRRAKRLTPLQAYAEVGASMHCGVVARLVARSWMRLRSDVRARLPSVRVHSSCAGAINAGFAAVRSALQGTRVQLVVATETVWWRRRALALQFAEAQLFEDARMPEAFMVACEVMVVSWPCQPNSAAKHVPPDAVEQMVQQAMDNARLLVDIVTRAANMMIPPLLIFLENVPGLVERAIFEPCCVLMATALESLGYEWEECVACPAALCIGPQQRRRWYGVGTWRAGM